MASTDATDFRLSVLNPGGRELETLVTKSPGVLEFIPNLPIQHHRTLTGNDFVIVYGPQNRPDNFRAKDARTTTDPTAEEKRRKGMWVFIREGSASKNLVDLVPMVVRGGSDRVALCTDDREPDLIRDRGHMNDCVRLAVEHGVPVQLVYWHEKAGYGEGEAKGQSITLKDGDNTKDLKVKPK